MYEAFYGLREQPFRVTPDPRFLFRTPAIDEAVAALTYGVEQRKGFLSLVGEVGTGKTTLLRHLLDSLPPTTQTVLILYPTVAFEEMLEHILHELGIPSGGGKFVRLQRLHEFLLEHTRAGGNAAIVIDEAQDLDARVLEELRLLSNLETGTEKILQILLAGQPELERKLAQSELRQLRQRIALHVRLRTLSAAEVAAYVETRLERAGRTEPLFEPDAVAYVAHVTEGIPRLINVLCDAALVTGFATGAPRITRPLVEEAWADYAHIAPSPAPPLSATASPAVGSPSEPAVHETAAPPAVASAAAQVAPPAKVEVEPAPVEPPPATVDPSPADVEDAPAPRGRGRRSVGLLALVAGSVIAAASLLWARAG